MIIVADQALKIWVKTTMSYHEQIPLIGSWFRLFFIENEGMAWGWKFGGEWGKVLLTVFRMVAVVFGVFYIRSIIKKKFHSGFIVCVSMIFAGALGNLIDSMFYGLIFEDSTRVAVAKMFPPKGYESFLHGRVVDMLYMPIIEDKILPSWVPIWGGERFTFFSPIFNLADASISIGVITILIFQKRFFNQTPNGDTQTTVDSNATVNDTAKAL